MKDKADTYCGKCIKADVCGMEGVYDPATTYCAYRVEDRPHGEWIKEYLQIDEHHFRSYAKCKVCGCSFKPYSFAVKEFDFCPKCGADMRKEDNEK